MQNLTLTTEQPNINSKRLNRSCGTCYACCVYLGIRSLNKPGGVKCKHLAKVRQDRKCTIYNHRPASCAKFLCMWRQGIVPNENYRPDKSGVLACMYGRNDETNPDSVKTTDQIAITLTITDYKKCNLLDLFDQTGILHDIVQNMTSAGVNDIKIVHHETKLTIHFLDGEIRRGKLLQSSDPEALTMETYDPPIGRYIVCDAKEL